MSDKPILLSPAAKKEALARAVKAIRAKYGEKAIVCERMCEMNQKEITEWLEDRGELMIMKKDGEGFVIAARAPDGMWKTAEAETLEQAITLWEEAC